MDALMWSYLAGGMAYLVPLALVLVVLSGLDEEDARATALLIPVVTGVVVLAYIAVGFAFEFGGVGLMDSRHGFSQLVWEWSPLPEQWGPYWGMAGFAGWLLWRGSGTPDAVALFWGHLPWILSASFIPVLVLRRRVLSLYPLLVAALMGGVVVPLAGNWAHGGGWLSRLGATLGWGHGYVDFGGGGLVGIVGGAAGLSLLLAFQLRRPDGEDSPSLPEVHFPALALIGSFLFVVGTAGWALNNPLYELSQLPIHRILANGAIGWFAGMVVPAFYLWFVADVYHPHFSFLGGWASWLAVLPGLPFLPPWVVLAVGLVVGGTTPLLIYVVRERLRLDDPAGLVGASLWGGLGGLIILGFLADGRYGSGWHGIGSTSYLGVPHQGVSGLWVAEPFNADWPGQMLAQLAGASAYFVWAFFILSVLGIVLALLSKIPHGLRTDSSPSSAPVEQADIGAAPVVEVESASHPPLDSHQDG